MFSHLREEFGSFGDATVGFLLTAISLVEQGNRSAQPRLGEAVAYCVREALKRILDSVEQPGAGRWQTASRRVTRAKRDYVDTRNLPGEDSEKALADLLQAIDDLEDFHKEEGLHQRRIIAVLVSRTGAVPVPSRVDVVVEYQRLIDDLNGAVHAEADLDQAVDLLEQSRQLLRRLFTPPDVRLEELDQLASIAEPTTADASRLEEIVYSPKHLEYFFGKVTSAGWLDLLMDSGLVTPPEGRAPWPVYRIVEHLVDEARGELADWLERAYDRWGHGPTRAHYLARAAADLGPDGYVVLLKALREHPNDSAVCHTVEWALRDADPTSPVVVEAADQLLNESSGLQHVSSVDRDHGILGMLVHGVTAENALDRLRLLSFKLRALHPNEESTLFFGQRSGSIAESSNLYLSDAFGAVLDGFIAALRRAFDANVGCGPILDAIAVLDDDLAARARAWVLANASDLDLPKAIEEVTLAISARQPTGDDLRLIDRITSSAPQEQYMQLWIEALGDPPDPESLGNSLADHTVSDETFRGREWCSILPDECCKSWKTATTLLASAYGRRGREALEYRSHPQVGTGRSPITHDELAKLAPLEAAQAVSQWRRDPSDWLVGGMELARTLEAIVQADSSPWLEAPTEVVATLREPIHINHYFCALVNTQHPLSEAAGRIMEAVSFCRTHPWEPIPLGRDDWDYEPDWRGVDQASVALIRKLADGDSGFAGHDQQAWDIVVSAIRDRSDDSAILAPRDDPLRTAINRPCTKALEAMVSLMAYDYRRDETIRQEALDIIDESLRLEGWSGAEHRAILATRLGFLLHIAPEWVKARADLLFGDDAPEGLGQATIDVICRYGRPGRWTYEVARRQILDASGREVDNALAVLMVGMLWEVPGYEPDELVLRLSEMGDRHVSAAGEDLARLLRTDDVEASHVQQGVTFWREALELDADDALPGFGWWAEVTALDQATWELLTRSTAQKAKSALDWSSAVAERVVRGEVSRDGLEILNQLVRGQVDEWDRLSIAENGVEALRLARKELSETEEYRRLRTTLIERGRFAKDL